MTITQETRREGLDHIEPKVANIAANILLALRTLKQATANEVQAATGISLNSVRSRLTELYGAGLVRPIGKKVNPLTGIRIAIWETV